MPPDRSFEDTKSVYFAEVIRQFDIMELALSQIRQAVRTANADTALGAGITLALGAGAVVSKLLWPNPVGDSDSKKWATRRGEALRSDLGVKADSILQSRDVRNSLEHFDERLDAFARQDYNTFVFTHWMVMGNNHVLGHSNDMPILRYIDPLSLIVRMPGTARASTAVTVDLLAVRDAMEQLASKARALQ